MPRYVIYSIQQSEGTPYIMWWNRALGWTALSKSATEFNEQERSTMELPMGDDVQWLKLLRPSWHWKDQESDL